MNKDVDWAGPWPAFVFQRDFLVWAKTRLRLGLELAALVTAIFIGVAAKMAGFEFGWIAAVGCASVGLVTRLEWVGGDRHHEH